MLGSRSKHVHVVFQKLPSEPQYKRDPLVKLVPFEQWYLWRMRELKLAYSLQYAVNASSIDNLYSHVDLATERVSEATLQVMGGTVSAQQAAAAFRSCRMLETPEDVSRRTMVSAACLTPAFALAVSA